MSRRKTTLTLSAIAGLTVLSAAALCRAAMAPMALPAGLDQSLDRTSEKGLFRVRIASATDPIPMHKIHSWSVRITDADGRPVPDAVITVGGGMPQHGHGLPTAPTAEAVGPPGDYVLNGVKFSMGGWWELKLDVAAAGVADRVTFNLVL